MSSKPYPFAPPPPQPSRAASSSATVNHHNSASAAVGSNAAASKSSAAVVQDPAFVPRDARLMSILLSATGVEAAEPHVVPLLLEWMNRYTLQVLADAQAFADHRMSAASGAGALSDFIRSEDVKLAISANTQHSFMAPPSKEVR